MFLDAVTQRSVQRSGRSCLSTSEKSSGQPKVVVGNPSIVPPIVKANRTLAVRAVREVDYDDQCVDVVGFAIVYCEIVRRYCMCQSGKIVSAMHRGA